ncbi:MAG: hypothetical protein H6811_06240 [Phycisphaeraceae bacterium]|nr:hypothetical protein [Phycisphaeraceae bacterium]
MATVANPQPEREAAARARADVRAEAAQRARIAIIVHRGATLEDIYFLTPIAEVWREMGHQVSVVSGPGADIDADVSILHVDLTIVPDDHAAFARRFPIAINGKTADISKRRISRQIVRRGDGYDGPVIVKTDRNCGGVKEASLAAGSSLSARCALGLRRRLPWPYRPDLPTAQYRIFEAACRVPRAAWRNPAFIVERFLTERQGEFTCLRTWVFLGDRETHSLSLSREPIVKADNVLERIVLGEVPDGLRDMRRELGFDFGKFDYAIVDGRVVLYDANRTPTLGRFSPEEFMPRIKHLAEGLGAFL